MKNKNLFNGRFVFKEIIPGSSDEKERPEGNFGNFLNRLMSQVTTGLTNPSNDTENRTPSDSPREDADQEPTEDFTYFGENGDFP